ncbi:MAG: alanine:cation symporter family protein, partial [Gammaproteobacteria bacterium]|nr:alanine:cation symporter family protein [Gammaproteobacteria bacterium]
MATKKNRLGVWLAAGLLVWSPPAASSWLAELVEGWVTPTVARLETVLFFKLPLLEIPFVVLWLLVGACYFTVRMNFINLRGFRHAIHITLGRYDDASTPGEISHFQALASALSATVGLGNIAGVALAVSAGGPGAIFWLVVAGLLGMSSKFTECTLAQMYRRVSADGTITGGPMVYLSDGLAALGWPRLGRSLGNLFAVFCIGGALGAGCMFQANQSFAVLVGAFPEARELDWLVGTLLAVAVGVVILGGIKRIALIAARLVPSMCLVYLLCAAYILLSEFAQIPTAVALIVSQAFAPESVYGGFLGVLVIGVQRAAFSNEAGIGS